MQQGFRTGRSCIDAVFIVKQQHKKITLEFKKPAFICFVDFEEAFDYLDLWDILNIFPGK